MHFLFRQAALAALLTLAAPCAAQSAEAGLEELKSLAAQLKAVPGDAGLRERLISLARAMDPLPPASGQAQRHMARGEAAYDGATDSGGVEEAVSEFQAAVNDAPWWGPAYASLARAQERAARPKEAARSLKLYLLALPAAKDAAETRKKIAALELGAAAAGAETPRQLKKKAKKLAKLIKKLDHARFAQPYDDAMGAGDDVIVLAEGELVRGVFPRYLTPAGKTAHPDWTMGAFTVRGPKTKASDWTVPYCDEKGACDQSTLTISPDGRTITELFYDGRPGNVYRR